METGSAPQQADRRVADRLRELLELNTPEFDALTGAARVGLWAWDLCAGVAVTTKSLQELYGLPVSAGVHVANPADWQRAVHEADRDRAAAALQDALDSDRAVYRSRYRIRRDRDHEVRTVQSVARIERDATGEPLTMLGLVQDITETAEHEAALQISEERLALALEVTGEGVFDWNVVTGEFWHAPRCAEVLGYDPDAEADPVARFYAAVHPDDLPAVRDRMDRHASEGQLLDSVYRFRHAIRGLRWLRSRGELLRDADGTPRRMIGSVADVTAQRRDQQLLEQVESIARIGGFRLQVATGLVDLSVGLLRLLGLDHDDSPQRLHQLLRRLTRVQRSELFGALRNRSVEDGGFELECVCALADGRKLRLHVTGHAECVDGRLSAVQGAVQDVTGQRQLEEHQLQVERLESVGRLAGGVAHDFNNLLMAILSAESLAATADLAVRHELDVIRTAAERAAGLTRDLLSFARLDPVRPALVHLDELLLRRRALFATALADGQALKLDCRAEVGAVHIDADRFEEVMLRLLRRVGSAMSVPGSVTIRLTARPLDARDAATVGLLPGVFACLEIGAESAAPRGMPEVSLFEPYGAGDLGAVGVGLDLSACFGLVKRFGGGLRAWSVGAAGRVFEIMLPEEPADQR